MRHTEIQVKGSWKSKTRSLKFFKLPLSRVSDICCFPDVLLVLMSMLHYASSALGDFDPILLVLVACSLLFLMKPS